MSTSLEPQPSPTPEQEDPWRYGWRYVRRVGADGQEDIEQVPLPQEGLLYPEESDFVVNTTGHNSDRAYLKHVLNMWAAGREGVLVVEDHRVDWQVAGLRPLGPDVAAFAGLREAWDPERGTFPVADFGARTLLAVEITSPDSRRYDLGIKLQFYHRAGVLFYAIVDRREARGGLDLRLLGYRADPANPDGYTLVPPDDRGRIWMEPVRLWLAAENGRAVCYDEHDRRILEGFEALRLAETAFAAAEQADARARADAEARQAAEAQARADAEARQAAEAQAKAEAQARQAMEARMKELEAELQRLRGEGKGGLPNPVAP